MKNLILLLILALSSQYSFGQNDRIVEFTDINDALLNPERVIRLNLSNQALNIPEAAWGKLINLEYLSLKDDHLIELPKGMMRLKSLKTLDLSGNDFKLLPNEILQLQNLEEIYLNDEKYLNIEKALTTLSKLPKLKSLHLENDNLSLIPNEIKGFQKLESLFLNGNKFTEFPKDLEDLEKLNYIEFYQNPIRLNEYNPNGNMIIKF